MAVQLMTVAQYARHRGCDEKAVRKAIAEGRISAITDARGKRRIDPAVADIQWAQNTRARADSARPALVLAGGQGVGVAQAADTLPAPESEAPAAAGDVTKGGYTDLRAQTEMETLRQKRRDNMVAEGQLADVVQLRRAVFDGFRALRDRAMAVSQRAAPRCIGLSDARDIERVIDDEVRRAFAEWAEQMQSKLPKPPEGAE